MKVFWTWSNSAKRMRQRTKGKEQIIMEPFYNIIKMDNHTKDLWS